MGLGGSGGGRLMVRVIVDGGSRGCRGLLVMLMRFRGRRGRFGRGLMLPMIVLGQCGRGGGGERKRARCGEKLSLH